MVTDHTHGEPKASNVNVLCGCGWGRLGIPESQVPQHCPMCGFDFFSLHADPEEE